MDYRTVDAECRGSLCIVIADGEHSHVKKSATGRTVIVLDLNADCRTVLHELIHAAGVDEEEDARVLEDFLAGYYCNSKIRGWR